jgi:NhaP-type Na+/H+ or K+/H+ antiporter
MSQPWFKAGLPVAVSKLGEMIFLAVGGMAGLACVAVVYSMFCLFLDGRGTLRRWQKGARALFLVLLAALVGLAAAAGASAVLKFVVATMPDEGLDVLTDEIPHDEPLLDDDS